MPVYLYKCKTCGKEFEYQQRITSPALKKCPAEICESEIKGEGTVERRISKNIGLVFNGKGFYLTDYVHKNGKAPPSNGTHHKSSPDAFSEQTDTVNNTSSDSSNIKKAASVETGTVSSSA